MNKEAFFDSIRISIFGGALSQNQVDGCNILLEEGEKRALLLEQEAYVLATAYHETAATMQPIAEYGKGQGMPYLTYYDSSKTTLCKYKPQGAYGRGYVQLTWEANYERADRELSLNNALINNFNLAMDPKIAAQIIFQGMLKGWFTGKKLSDYIDDTKIDYYNARRIVNGTDRAELIANYADSFEAALKSAKWGSVVPIEPVEPPTIDISELVNAITDLQNALKSVIAALDGIKTGVK